jgi:hypothetical protein
MGMRLRHSIQLFPGFRINLSGSGVSATVGIPGANINFGPNGTRTTVGLPGSGISYVHSQVYRGPQPPQTSARSKVLQTPQTHDLSPSENHLREIGSNAVTNLTSNSLDDFKQCLKENLTQRASIEQEIGTLRAKLNITSTKLKKRKKSLFRYFYRKSIQKKTNEIYWLTADITGFKAALSSSVIPLEFDLSQPSQIAYGKLVRAFASLGQCKSKWDLIANREIKGKVERSLAKTAIVRKSIQLEFQKLAIFNCQSNALKFQNANGEDLNFLPSILFMEREDKEFGVIDLREIELYFTPTEFRESESIPEDTQVVGHAWAKENKDGSRDFRFADNYQIPVCLYGQISFTTKQGLNELYMFSNMEAARNFCIAFEELKNSLPALRAHH